MTDLKRISLGILALCILAWPSLSLHADGLSSVDQATIQVPLSTWNELKSNNTTALNLIKASKIPLTEAHSLINKEANELQELKSINIKQSQKLMKAQNDLMKQNAYLNEMQSSLNELSKDIKKNKATEQRLHRQRNTWALISGLLLVGLAVK